MFLFFCFRSVPCFWFFFFFQAEDGIRDGRVTGVQTCALPIFDPALVDEQGGCGQLFATTDKAATFAANRAIGNIALAVKMARGTTLRARVREEGALRVRCPGARAAELEAVIVNTA